MYSTLISHSLIYVVGCTPILNTREYITVYTLVYTYTRMNAKTVRRTKPRITGVEIVSHWGFSMLVHKFSTNEKIRGIELGFCN